LAAVLVFRLAVAASWHQPAGDGLQYWELSQQLSARHRLAFQPVGEPDWTRLPGYPLFLSYVAVRAAPASLNAHLYRATAWNVLLDFGSALLIGTLLARRFGRAVGGVAVALIVMCPLMVFLSCYGLTESLATFLGTLELWLAARATETRRLRWLAGAGVAGGLAQLTRVDMLAMVPAVAALIVLSPSLSRRTRALALAIYAAGYLVAFAPWPIRNQLHFGATHAGGTEWIGQLGQPLPTGMLRWMRTWSRGATGESYVNVQVANGAGLDRDDPGMLTPQMYDDESEHQRLRGLYRMYNRQRLSLAVDEEFRELARDRARAHPLRQWVTLPLQRLRTLWKPVPAWELPMKTRLLGLPRARSVWDDAQLILCLLGAAGAIWLARRDRALLAAFALAIVGRSVVIAFIHPFPTQRYVAEVMPLLMGMAAMALVWTARRLRRGDA